LLDQNNYVEAQAGC